MLANQLSACGFLILSQKNFAGYCKKANKSSSSRGSKEKRNEVLRPEED
jgi:hypothetical protein